MIHNAATINQQKLIDAPHGQLQSLSAGRPVGAIANRVQIGRQIAEL
jgi:hypothetical protein